MSLYIKDTLREILGLPTSQDIYRRRKKEVERENGVLNGLISLNELKLKKEQEKMDELTKKAKKNTPISYNDVYMTMRSKKTIENVLKNLYRKRDINLKTSDMFLEHEINKNLLVSSEITTEMSMASFGNIDRITALAAKEERINSTQEVLYDALGITTDTQNVEDEVADEALEFFSTHYLDQDIHAMGLVNHNVIQKKGNNGGDAMLVKNEDTKT